MTTVPPIHIMNVRRIRRATLRMMTILGWTMVLLASARAQDGPGTDSLLATVRALYENGSFVSAELEARRLLDQDGVGDSVRILAEQYVAFSLIAQGKNAPAAEYFVSILRADSTYTLDPLLTSPKIMTVYEEGRRRFSQERAQTSPPVRTPVEPPPSGPSFRLLLFPGWDQLHQGRTTKGTILLSAGALSLGSLVTFDVLRRSAREDYLSATSPEEATARYDDYDKYYKAEYYSAAAFVAVYLYSAFDAFLDLPPRLDAARTRDGSGVQLSLAVPF